jgi:hypothetical protein
MNKYIKALIIGLIICSIHLSTFSMIGYLQHNNFGFYGLLGGIIYGFVFGFWAYYILTLAYLYITKFTATTLMKLVYALVIVTIGYFIARTGDIIDGDFVRKFDFLLLLTFLLSSPLLVLLDRFFSSRRNLT